jgi:aminoglycoside phosphotransferase (APT) family kinase protein
MVSMSVSYSSIKAASEPEAIAELLATRVIGPVMPSVVVKKVRPKSGRRFEAPRVMWNVYEAELELAGGIAATSLIWTKAFFTDEGCREYQQRISRLLSSQNGNPLDPRGYVQFFSDLNLFLFFFPTDPVFPKMSSVFDPQAMAPMLREHFLELSPTAQIESLNATRVKYLPEISCIVRYDAEVGAERPLTIYGKLQHSKRGAMTYEVMQALWDLPARQAGDLIVSRPLAYYPSHSLLLQSELQGDEIKSDRHSEIFMAQCEAAGRAIGHIHNSGISVGQPHTAEVEIERLELRLEQFKVSAPRIFFLLRDLLKHIAVKAEKVLPEAPVPSHGDYKYNQFLYDGEHFGMIDVEYFVQAEPSFDLGKYCGHLVPSNPKDWSDSARAEECRRLFLDAYLSVRPAYKGARFSLYEALSLATRALVVAWSQPRNWEHTAETLVAMGFERLKTRWGE